MKAKLVVLSLFMMVGLCLTGCTNNDETCVLQEQNRDNVETNSNQAYENLRDDPEFDALMCQLEAINDSLARGGDDTTRVTIQIQWNGLKNVVKADMVGAFKGFKSGLKDGGILTAITRAAFQGMWYSMASAFTIKIKMIPSPYEYSLEKSYLAAYLDYHAGTYADVWYTKTNLTAVANNSPYLEIARLHNLACVNHINGVRSNLPLSGNLSDSDIASIQSQELMSDLQSITSFLQGEGGTNPYQPNVQDKTDMVMNAYLTSLDNNLYGSEIVSKSANSYIPTVLNNASLSADAKNRVVSSICVACYSEVLWK